MVEQDEEGGRRSQNDTPGGNRLRGQKFSVGDVEKKPESPKHTNMGKQTLPT